MWRGGRGVVWLTARSKRDGTKEPDGMASDSSTATVQRGDNPVRGRITRRRAAPKPRQSLYYSSKGTSTLSISSSIADSDICLTTSPRRAPDCATRSFDRSPHLYIDRHPSAGIDANVRLNRPRIGLDPTLPLHRSRPPLSLEFLLAWRPIHSTTDITLHDIPLLAGRVLQGSAFDHRLEKYYNSRLVSALDLLRTSPPSFAQSAPNMAGTGGGHRNFRTFNQDFVVDDRYTVTKELGQGAYGIVCAATNNVTGEGVAVKKLTNVFSKKILAKRALREMKLLRHFRGHRNITCLYDLDIPRPDHFNETYLYEGMLFLASSLLSRTFHH